MIKRRRVLTANVFTPNGDGMNDVLLMTGGLEVSYIMEWSIFDRWGNVVFKKIDFLPNTSNASWDGTLNGKIMPTGLYTWYAKVLYLDGEPIDHTGEATLIR